MGYNFSKEELYKLYIEDKLTVLEVANQLDCSSRSVSRWLKKYNIPTRQSKDRKSKISIDSREKFLQLYEEIGLTGIAKKFNVCYGTVFYYAKVNNISLKEIKAKRVSDVIDDIVIDYQNGISLFDIKRNYNLPYHKIVQGLKSKNIKIRDSGEAIRASIKCPRQHLTEKQTQISSKVSSRGGSRSPGFKGKGVYADDGTWLSLTKTGYLKRTCKNHPLANKYGYIMEHVYQAALAWGVDHVRGKEIHHINGIKDDNRWENLLPVSKKDHRLIEMNFFLHRIGGRPTPENFKSVMILEMLHFDDFREKIINLLDQNNIFVEYKQNREDRIKSKEKSKESGIKIMACLKRMLTEEQIKKFNYV